MKKPKLKRQLKINKWRFLRNEFMGRYETICIKRTDEDLIREYTSKGFKKIMIGDFYDYYNGEVISCMRAVYTQDSRISLTRMFKQTKNLFNEINFRDKIKYLCDYFIKEYSDEGNSCSFNLAFEEKKANISQEDSFMRCNCKPKNY